MNILILAKDPNLIHPNSEVSQRHRKYAERLNALQPNSSIKIVTYSKNKNKFEIPLGEHACVYSTCSASRVFYLWDANQVVRVLTKNWKPDLITAQEPWEEGLLGFYWTQKLLIPLVAQLHFDLFSKYWLKEFFLNYAKSFLGKWVFRRASHVRVVSSVLKEKIQNYLDISSEKISVIPVSVSLMGSAQSRKIKSSPVLLFVGRLVSQKNLLLWIKIAQKIVASNIKVQFVWAGDGPLRSYLERLIEQKGLKVHFQLLGQVGYENLATVYEMADVFLLTSDYEGYGRVVAEAALAGVPSVATRCSGPEDLIRDGETGYLRAIRDEDGLYQKVMELLGDLPKARKMGQSARDYIQANFSEEVLIKKLVDCWMELKK